MCWNKPVSVLTEKTFKQRFVLIYWSGSFCMSTGQLILKHFPHFFEVSCRLSGNPWCAAAASSKVTARWPWECHAVASFWQYDKSLNQRTGLMLPRASKIRRGGKGMLPHQVPEVMVWKCTMSLSVFCYVAARWREKTGKRGEVDEMIT